MLAIQVNVNIFLIVGLVLIAAIIGFMIRSSQLISLNKKITELEKEMLASHAEILQLQRDKIEILKTVTEPSIPVISITSNKEEKPESLPDIAIRKKLLGTSPAASSMAKQQSGS